MGTICMPINVKIHWVQMDVRLLHSAYSETAACKDKAGNATFGEFAYRGGMDESVILRLMFDTEIRRMSPFGRNRRCTGAGSFKHSDGAKAAKHQIYFLSARPKARS